MAVREIREGRRGVACGAVIDARPRDPARDCRTASSLVPYFFWMVFDAREPGALGQPAGTHVVEEREVLKPLPSPPCGACLSLAVVS